MAYFGKTSKIRLATCHPDIQKVMHKVISLLPWTDDSTGIRIYDCIIIEGHRNKNKQDYVFATGKSKAPWPDSNHNTLPSNAVDTLPYHRDRPHLHWSNKDEMEVYSRFVLSVASDLCVHLRSGLDWDQDGIRVDYDPDESFFDGAHYELI